jgi:phosphoenolpyruvate-protein phosphotransferase (PTS system enzyme I)
MELKLTGRAASPGIFVGPAVALSALAAHGRRQGSPAEEERALMAAIAASREEVSALASSVNGDATRILGIQVALLEDDALSEAARAAIANGAAADSSWRDAMAVEIAGYERAEDEYFRARAADLIDVRDRVLRHLLGVQTVAEVAAGSVVVARDLPPSLFLSFDWSKGGAIVLGEGSPTSHVAMLARARGVPMVVGIGGKLETLAGTLVVDGEQGSVVAAPGATTLAEVERRRAASSQVEAEARSHLVEPAITRDGTRVAVMINVATPSDLDELDSASCDGIGLVRTEFLVANGALRDEERQFSLYRDLVMWATGRPVTIRTLDAGGDKPIPGYTVAGEANPFLGVRGVRLSLRHPDVFRVQLRALARAAALGHLKVMLPMVTTTAELAEARAILQEEVESLRAEGLPAALPALGIMVEVPAAAIAVDQFDAAFFSIGSNDLVQYVTASSRDSGQVGGVAELTHTGVLRLIAAVAAHGSEVGREVSLCGDAGGDPRAIPALLSAGVRTLSVAPALLARTKAAIRAVDLGANADTAAASTWWRRIKTALRSSGASAARGGPDT